MAKQRKLFDPKNIVTTLKGVVVGITTNILTGLFIWLSTLFPIAGVILLTLWLLFVLFMWGFIANRWFGWK